VFKHNVREIIRRPLKLFLFTISENSSTRLKNVHFNKEYILYCEPIFLQLHVFAQTGEANRELHESRG
jgi:hypothetical protein